MPKSPLLKEVAEATERFCAELAQAGLSRIQAKVASRDGMPLLCAVEAVLREGGSGSAPRELVWLSGRAEGSAHRLQLRAFGDEGRLICEAEHAFDG